MKWIKASERMPPEPGSPKNYYRVNGEHKVNGNFYDYSPTEVRFGVVGNNTHADYDILQKNFHLIEWLDESSDFTPEELDLICEALVSFQHTLHGYMGWKKDQFSQDVLPKKKKDTVELYHKIRL